MNSHWMRFVVGAALVSALSSPLAAQTATPPLTGPDLPEGWSLTLGSGLSWVQDETGWALRTPSRKLARVELLTADLPLPAEGRALMWAADLVPRFAPNRRNNTFKEVQIKEDNWGSSIFINIDDTRSYFTYFWDLGDTGQNILFLWVDPSQATGRAQYMVLGEVLRLLRINGPAGARRG